MFIDQIYRQARSAPDSLAVVNSGEEISYRRFANTIETVRNHLKRMPLPGDGVIVNITSNLYQDWVLLLALRSLGHTTVSGTSWAVIESLKLKNIAGLVCLSGQTEVSEAFRQARPDCPLVEVPRQMMWGANNGPPPLPVEDGAFGDHVLYTSGTTGTYKKLLMAGRSTAADIERFLAFPERKLTASDVYHNCNFGPWTAAGYQNPLRRWYRGAAVIFEQRADWTRYFCDYPVSMTTLVPPMVEQLVKANVTRPPTAPRLRMFVGGGFVSAQVAIEAADRLHCDLFVGYGGTEFKPSLQSLVRSEEDVVWLWPSYQPGIEIVDEQDQPVRQGEEGLLRLKSAPTDPDGYIDDAEATAKHFRDGYFYPGDMAVQREDGRIRILGRVDDVINLAGQKVAIAPFEQMIRSVLGVQNVCAFALQDEGGQDRLLIVIEGSSLPERPRLQALARRVKQVPHVRFSLVARFPRGDNGMMKVNRRKLLDLVRRSDAEQAGAKPEKPGISASAT